MNVPSVDELYAKETATIVAARLPSLVLVFAIVFSFAWLFEYWAHPERTRLYAVIFGLELIACAGAIALTRSERGRPYGVPIVAVACTILFGLIATYHATLGGETEIMALAVMYIVTGITVGLPLGGWGQLPIAVGAVCAYLAAIVCGAKSTASILLTTLGLVSIGALSVAGAAFFDRYRYASFRRAEELRKANAALAQANEAKNLFLANVSHELRTPLNVILGYAQLMLENNFGPLPATLREPLERVVANTHGLVYMISDLLDLSRIEAGRLTVQLERVELGPLFAELGMFVAHTLGTKPVRFVSEDPDQLAVTADRDRLRQVLVNLLSNAEKFTAHGEIRLRAGASNGEVFIEVSDTGVGILPEDLPHVFEPFRRAANAKEFRGVGIGLSISDRLVRAMGGHLTAESVPNVGARFGVYLHPA